jgi:hypothetical protein
MSSSPREMAGEGDEDVTTPFEIGTGAAMSSSPWERLCNGDEDVTTPVEGVLGLRQGAKKCALRVVCRVQGGWLSRNLACGAVRVALTGGVVRPWGRTSLHGKIASDR